MGTWPAELRAAAQGFRGSGVPAGGWTGRSGPGRPGSRAGSSDGGSWRSGPAGPVRRRVGRACRRRSASGRTRAGGGGGGEVEGVGCRPGPAARAGPRGSRARMACGWRSAVGLGAFLDDRTARRGKLTPGQPARLAGRRVGWASAAAAAVGVGLGEMVVGATATCPAPPSPGVVVGTTATCPAPPSPGVVVGTTATCPAPPSPGGAGGRAVVGRGAVSGAQMVPRSLARASLRRISPSSWVRRCRT